MSDIIDQIDALVDDQLAGGEPRTGYDYGDPQYPDCPHCGRKWHGLPITARIAEMYAAGEFDEDYRVDTDDSDMLCRGSDFIGPMPAEGSFNPWGWYSIAMDLVVDWAEFGATEQPGPLMVIPSYPSFEYTPVVTYINSAGQAVTGTAVSVDRGDGYVEPTITLDDSSSALSFPAYEITGPGSFEL